MENVWQFKTKKYKYVFVHSKISLHLFWQKTFDMGFLVYKHMINSLKDTKTLQRYFKQCLGDKINKIG